MKNKKNKEKNEPKEEERKLMKHFVEIGIPMHDLLYAHIRQANIGIEVGRSMFDGPAGECITIDLINVLAAEWIQSIREKMGERKETKAVDLSDPLAYVENAIDFWERYHQRFLDVPRMRKNYDDKILIDTMKKYMEDSERVINSPAFKSLKDGVAKLIHDSAIGVSVFAKIIDPTDKKPYKEKIEFKEEGSWMRDDILGAAFCVKGIDRDCYIDTFGVRHLPMVCTFLGKPKFKEGENIFANQEDVFVVEKITYDDSYSQFRYHGTMRSGMAINARESLCGPYVEKKPRYSKGTMLFLIRSNQKFIVINYGLTTDGEFVYEGITANGDTLLANESFCVQYIPKPAVIGKPAIFWNKIKSEALCGVLVQTYNEHYTPNRKLYFENACLLESLEQYELFVK